MRAAAKFELTRQEKDMIGASANRAALFAIVWLASLQAGVASARPVEQEHFGQTLEGWPVEQYVLTNNKGASVRLINYGAIVTNLFVPDKNGKMEDVVLGFDDVKQYQESGPFIGCIAGRYANRIANGTFTIDGARDKAIYYEVVFK